MVPQASASAIEVVPQRLSSMGGSQTTSSCFFHKAGASAVTTWGQKAKRFLESCWRYSSMMRVWKSWFWHQGRNLQQQDKRGDQGAKVPHLLSLALLEDAA